jgi:hypothetical protein
MILDSEAIRCGNRWLCHRHASGLAARPWRASFVPEKPNGSFQIAFNFDSTGYGLGRLTKKAGGDKFGRLRIEANVALIPLLFKCRGKK